MANARERADWPESHGERPATSDPDTETSPARSGGSVDGGCLSGAISAEVTTAETAVPSTSNEDAATELDVYQRAAVAYIVGNPDVGGTNPEAAAPDLAAHGPFRAAVDEARRDLLAELALYKRPGTPTYQQVLDSHADLLGQIDEYRAEMGDMGAESEGLRAALAAARATIAEQDTTIGAQAQRIAEQDIEATKLATSGHWTTHYAIDTDEGHVWYSRARLPADVVVVAERPAWEGPAEPVEQLVDGQDGDQG